MGYKTKPRYHHWGIQMAEKLRKKCSKSLIDQRNANQNNLEIPPYTNQIGQE